MTEEQREQFEALARQMMKWLCDNCHPHVTVVIDPTSAQLGEGTIAFTTIEYVKD